VTRVIGCSTSQRRLRSSRAEGSGGGDGFSPMTRNPARSRRESSFPGPRAGLPITYIHQGRHYVVVSAGDAERPASTRGSRPFRGMRRQPASFAALFLREAPTGRGPWQHNRERGANAQLTLDQDSPRGPSGSDSDKAQWTGPENARRNKLSVVITGRRSSPQVSGRDARGRCRSPRCGPGRPGPPFGSRSRPCAGVAWRALYNRVEEDLVQPPG